MPRHFVKMNSLYNVHCITIHVYKSLSPAHRTQLAGLSCPILWSDHPRENIFSIIICIIYLFVCIDQLKGIKKCPDPMLAYTNLAETAQEKSINFFLRWYALIKLMKYYQPPVPSPITLRAPIGADQRRENTKFQNLIIWNLRWWLTSWLHLANLDI